MLPSPDIAADARPSLFSETLPECSDSPPHALWLVLPLHPVGRRIRSKPHPPFGSGLQYPSQLRPFLLVTARGLFWLPLDDEPYPGPVSASRVACFPRRSSRLRLKAQTLKLTRPAGGIPSYWFSLCIILYKLVFAKPFASSPCLAILSDPFPFCRVSRRYIVKSLKAVLPGLLLFLLCPGLQGTSPWPSHFGTRSTPC